MARSPLLCGILLLGCAGELENPERFDAVLEALDAASATQDATAPPPPAAGDAGASPPVDSGGGGGLDAGGSETVPACVTEVLEGSCGTVGCHAARSPQVDLVSEGLTARLLDQMSTSAICRGRMYVASDGGASLLLDKLTAMPPCGSRMPLIGTLTNEQQMCLEQWVGELGGR